MHPQMYYMRGKGCKEKVVCRDFGTKPRVIPELTFTEDVVDEPELRGPILIVVSQFSETLMTYKSPKSKSVVEALMGGYFFDQNHHFSITTKCKDMKYLLLKNVGTAAIRYQWFRNPPSNDARKMLGDPSLHKSLNGCRRNSSQSGTSVQTKPAPEFMFSGLPDVILPGNTVKFPIIFRSKIPGYYNQTIYLLTHPTVSNRDNRFYAVSLSGVCTEIELAEVGNELHDVDSLSRFLIEKRLEAEAKDILDAVLARSCWNATHGIPSQSLSSQCQPAAASTGQNEDVGPCGGASSTCVFCGSADNCEEEEGEEERGDVLIEEE